jgi:hypothetical protein
MRLKMASKWNWLKPAKTAKCNSDINLRNR